jgi:hypothetical protein
MLGHPLLEAALQLELALRFLRRGSMARPEQSMNKYVGGGALKTAHFDLHVGCQSAFKFDPLTGVRP